MIGGFAALVALFAFVDPRLKILVWAGVALALVSFHRERPRFPFAVFALSLAVPTLLGFSVGADSLNYFAYTSSLLVDHDLDLSNQWARLGFVASSLTATGHVPNAMAVGPGLIWIPAVALTHLWLALTGGPTEPLRLATPYYAAAAATTLALVIAGCVTLLRTLETLFGETEARLAVLASLFASPVLYYAAVQPLMSHGLTFAVAALTVALTLRADRGGDRNLWALCGASLGLAMLCRTQAVVLAVFVAVGLWRARASWRMALVVAGAALAVFSPQPIAWKILYGSFLTIPQGSGFIDWTGRHAIDVLVSADRGLFNRHPVLLLGLTGWLIALRRTRGYAGASLAIFSFTAFLNGSVRDWNASAAFGARRFDLVIPLFAFGLAALLSRARPFLAGRPLLLPAAALLLAAVWNASLIDLRRGTTETALPLDDLAQKQTAQARRAADASLGHLGPWARGVIYKAFVGLFAYDNYRPGGDFDLATLEPRFLRTGWSDIQAWDDGSLFRYLLYPKACLIIPIAEPFDLRGFVLARSPARIEGQRITLSLNGHNLVEADLPSAWTEIPFDAPRHLWVAGENEFCLLALKKRPGDEAGDLAYAAAVLKVQLP